MTEVVYQGKDLEAMSFAEKYHKWILNEFRPYIGKHLVEVGAGTGGFSQLLLGEEPKSLTMVEPSEMYASLRQNIHSDQVELAFHNNIFADVANLISDTQRPDTVLYINVLEHIEDDRGELQMVYDCLAPGGQALIYVPALPALYGAFDRQVGHFRRYRKAELTALAIVVGFTVTVAKYFDFLGMILWYVKYKVLRSKSFTGGMIKLYDNLFVPPNRLAESLVTPPIGKNLLFVLQKPI